MKKNALLSVYHKDGIVEFAKELVTLDWNIIASGGTAKTLVAASVKVTDVSEISGLSPILGHRVVTLVPHIHGGLMATEEMRPELETLGYPWIDLLCVDLYPLKEATRADGATTESVIEKTDIGGPALIRSAAKGRRIVVVEPEQRKEIIEWLQAGEPDGEAFRNSLAAMAEGMVADYCLESARFHSGGAVDGHISR
jgi:AICAR transformylase/IMP cyclohydrolase PurH (only IMP cyclohydrolase domain in Aful)